MSGSDWMYLSWVLIGGQAFLMGWAMSGRWQAHKQERAQREATNPLLPAGMAVAMSSGDTLIGIIPDEIGRGGEMWKAIGRQEKRLAEQGIRFVAFHERMFRNAIVVKAGAMGVSELQNGNDSLNDLGKGNQKQDQLPDSPRKAVDPGHKRPGRKRRR